MSDVLVTVIVEITQSNGDYTKVMRVAKPRATADNPLFFANYVEDGLTEATGLALRNVEDQFGERRDDR